MKKILKLRFVFRALVDLGQILVDRTLFFKEKLDLIKAIGRLKFLLFTKEENTLISFHLGGKKIEAYNNPSLQFLIKEIFVGKIYKTTAAKASNILDIGANIGLATLFFSKEFSAAKIKAFEPDQQSFDLLNRNVQHFHSPSIVIKNEAVGIKDGVLFAENSTGFASINSRFTNMESGEKVKAISLSKLLDDKYDIVKMDIEGGEWDVLRDVIANDKLRMADHWLVEFHPVNNSSNLIDDITKSFERCNFSSEKRKDVVYFYKNDIKP